MIDLAAAIARVRELLAARGIDPTTHYSVNVEVDHRRDGDHAFFSAYVAVGDLGLLAPRTSTMDEALAALAVKLDHHVATRAPRAEPEDLLVVVPEPPPVVPAPVDVTEEIPF